MKSPTVVRFLFVIAFVLCLTLTLNAGVEPIKIMPDEGSRNDSPVIAFDSQGTLWIAWSSFQNGKYRLAVASCSPEGKVSPIQYPDTSPTDQVDPVWAFQPEGTPCVIYSAHDGKEWRICKISVSRQGLKKHMLGLLGHGTRPTAVIARKRLWIAWEQDPNLVILTLGAHEKASQNKAEEVRNLGDLSADTKIIFKPDGPMARLAGPKLAAGPNGEVWLAWEAARPGHRSIRLQRIDKPSHDPMVVDDGQGINRHPSLSVDADGRVWLAYERMRTDKPAAKQRTQGPTYVYDQTYYLTRPSRAVVVTDGRKWWTPEPPREPAWGMGPNLLCSKKGTVWLLSRRHRNFFPLCESLGPKGWTNHGAVWGNRRDYRDPLPLAESPDGAVWTAWIEHHRESTGFKKAPAWSRLDGPDTILMAPMPSAQQPGKPRLVSRTVPARESSPVVTFPKYSTEYQDQKWNVYFGDLHVHSEFSGCGWPNGAIEEDVAYSRDVRGLDFYAPGDHAEHLNDHNWRETLMALHKHDRPGRFVPYMAFEWTSEFDRYGSLYRGHYNAIFRQLDQGERYFSASEEQTNTPLEMWTALRRAVGGPENILTFGHHTSRRYAWISWCYYDPEMAPLIEIAQTRGSYEYEGCPRGSGLAGDCSRVAGHFIQDGLARGMRFGIAANGDHAGRALTAVFAPELDRDSLFRAMRAKRTYGTNGQRMFLDVRVNDHFMGEEFRADGDAPRTITIHAQGTRPLIHVDLFRNGRVIRHWNGGRDMLRAQFVDTEPLVRRDNYYYVRVMQQDDGLAWSSPTWVVNENVPGRLRFQLGGDELHVIYPEEETDFSILMHNETDQTIEADVTLDLPEGWTIKEKSPMRVKLPAGGWTHAVFNVTAPKSAFSKLCLPNVIARCRQTDGTTHESSLFVIGSPYRIGNENKCKLIEAQIDLTPDEFEQYIEKVDRVWKAE
ncbi:MAG: DUF3604 domain-containing protein [Pirellulales bacterium]|nr:DUF3604 domain-containing protein [Pirellulales bacterium]